MLKNDMKIIGILMSLEVKVDKILEKLEKTSVDIAVLCTIVKENKEDIKKNEQEIDDLRKEVNNMKTEVAKIKDYVKIAKWAVGLVISAIGAIIFSILDFFK